MISLNRKRAYTNDQVPKRPTVNGHDVTSAGDERRRQAMHRRVEIAIALLIPALVVGIPFLTNYGRSRPTSVATSGRPASESTTTPTTVTVAPSATLIGAPGPIDDPAGVDGLPAKPDSTFWDLYQVASRAVPAGVGAPGAPGASPPPSNSTPTTGGTTTPGAGSTPTSTPPTTTSTTSPTSKKASVPRPPTNLLMDFDSPSLIARWEAVSTNADGTAFVDFQAYEVNFSAAGLSTTYETTSPSFTYTIVQNRLDFGIPQAELTVTVSAVAHTGNRSGPLAGVATNDVPATPTAPPVLVADSTSVTVTEPGQGSVDDLAGFEIYHSTSGAVGTFDLIASTVGSAAFPHDGLVTGTTHHYVYKIRDVFGQVSPGLSESATTTTS